MRSVWKWLVAYSDSRYKTPFFILGKPVAEPVLIDWHLLEIELSQANITVSIHTWWPKSVHIGTLRASIVYLHIRSDIYGLAASAIVLNEIKSSFINK